jgi:hypothetical protein
MIILGLDPGLGTTGWGLIRAEGNRLSHLANGRLKTDTQGPLPRRLAHLDAMLAALIVDHAPEAAAVEEVFVNSNRNRRSSSARRAAWCSAPSRAPGSMSANMPRIGQEGGGRHRQCRKGASPCDGRAAAARREDRRPRRRRRARRGDLPRPPSGQRAAASLGGAQGRPVLIVIGGAWRDVPSGERAAPAVRRIGTRDPCTHRAASRRVEAAAPPPRASTSTPDLEHRHPAGQLGRAMPNSRRPSSSRIQNAARRRRPAAPVSAPLRAGSARAARRVSSTSSAASTARGACPRAQQMRQSQSSRAWLSHRFGMKSPYATRAEMACGAFLRTLFRRTRCARLVRRFRRESTGFSLPMVTSHAA